MQIIERGVDRLVVLGGAMIHEEDWEFVVDRSRRTGKKFSEALADYVRDLREWQNRHVANPLAPIIENPVRG